MKNTSKFLFTVINALYIFSPPILMAGYGDTPVEVLSPRPAFAKKVKRPIFDTPRSVLQAIEHDSDEDRFDFARQCIKGGTIDFVLSSQKKLDLIAEAIFTDLRRPEATSNLAWMTERGRTQANFSPAQRNKEAAKLYSKSGTPTAKRGITRMFQEGKISLLEWLKYRFF